MLRTCILSVAFAIALFGHWGAAASAQPKAGGGQNPPAVQQQVIVQMTPEGNVAAINQQYGTSTIGSVPSRHLFLLELPAHISPQALIQMLDNNPQVQWSERNYFNQCPEGSTQSFFFSIVTAGEYEAQYAWSTTSLAAAHAITQGDGVRVAVLDTGLDSTHSVMQSRIAPGGFNFVGMNGDFSDVATGIDSDGDGYVDEMVGHGTYVSGLILAVAPQSLVLPIKVLDSNGLGTAFRVTQGLYHAIDHDAHVINLSLGAEAQSMAMANAIAAARAAGIVVVAAAGNNNVEHPAAYPASDPNTMAVAATNSADFKATFSNYGSHITISAPGVDVVSTLPGDQYAKGAGTSMSTAIISGAAALARSRFPQATVPYLQSQLTWSADCLNVANPQYLGKLGAGRLDAAGSLFRPGDVNRDGVVNVADLLVLINSWGPCPAGTTVCGGDVNNSGAVDVNDLLILLNNWG